MMYNVSSQIIDDNIYEAAEHFELLLSNPSPGARLGSVSKSIATIDGPNDGKFDFKTQLSISLT